MKNSLTGTQGRSAKAWQPPEDGFFRVFRCFSKIKNGIFSYIESADSSHFLLRFFIPTIHHGQAPRYAGVPRPPSAPQPCTQAASTSRTTLSGALAMVATPGPLPPAASGALPISTNLMSPPSLFLSPRISCR